MHTQQELGIYIGAFFDELMRQGVHHVVISPGSRSTTLAMVAFEAHQRFGNALRLYVDVDERGAAFFALGIAKACGQPVALVCTSGTAVANYYPAVLEAQASRVPLVVLSGDRPLRLQGLGAPQTCDQVKVFSSAVRLFMEAPEPSATPASVRHVRQIAREAVAAAAPGTNNSAPVHVNFYVDEPLTPAIDQPGLFEAGRATSSTELPGLVLASGYVSPGEMSSLLRYVRTKRTVILAGEGTLSKEAVHNVQRREREVYALGVLAEALDAPVLADVLSQVRGSTHPAVVTAYNRMLAAGACPPVDVVIRFGRYPIAKRVEQWVEQCQPAQIVVDPCQSRDFAALTTTMIKAEPMDFVAAMLEASEQEAQAEGGFDGGSATGLNIATWAALNQQYSQGLRVAMQKQPADEFEGAYVRALLDLIPHDALLFCANSVSVRAVDALYEGAPRGLTVLANRGLNGIDGTLSTALGAAQHFAQTVLVTGDLSLLHDINALALQRELLVHSGTQGGTAASAPAILVVLLNNNGGAIFSMLPQQSESEYFERLFTTPQDVNFEAAANAFQVPYAKAQSVNSFERICSRFIGVGGISLVEVPVALDAKQQRLATYW